MARPSKFSPERAAVILLALRRGNTRTHTAAYAGISRETLYAWARRYPAFSTAMEKAEAEAVMEALANIMEASKKDWRAAAWFQERRYPQDWGRRRAMNVADIPTERLVVILEEADGVGHDVR